MITTVEPATAVSQSLAEPLQLLAPFLTASEVVVAIPLVQKLCAQLTEEKINYCHWKSNNALDRSALGKNDLDLLISKADMARFAEILFRLGFKQAIAPADKQMTGVLDYFGYDAEADVLVHVHAHYQLMLGHDMTKGFRLPIEKAYLESSSLVGIFRAPAPEFEYIVLVIRMTLKHSTWDAILGCEGSLKKSELSELQDLRAQIDRAKLQEILAQHLSYVGDDLFQRCEAGLVPGCSQWQRIKAAHNLQMRLQTYARYPLVIDTGLKLGRRVAIALRRRIFKSTAKYQLQSGGATIALIGGDGAGKSTAIKELYSWLSKQFDTTNIHLGRPGWSLSTRITRTVLKMGQLLGLYPSETLMEKTLAQKSLVSPGYPWLIREVCTARDRYLVYLRAQRFVANGGIAILDRFPHDRLKLMDGPRTELFTSRATQSPIANGWLNPTQESRLAKLLARLEKSYYQRIVPPDVLAVLVLHPDIAVARKVEEDPHQVRVRNHEVWSADWHNTNAHVIDASKPREIVLAELKALIWSKL